MKIFIYILVLISGAQAETTNTLGFNWRSLKSLEKEQKEELENLHITYEKASLHVKQNRKKFLSLVNGLRTNLDQSLLMLSLNPQENSSNATMILRALRPKIYQKQKIFLKELEKFQESHKKIQSVKASYKQTLLNIDQTESDIKNHAQTKYLGNSELCEQIQKDLHDNPPKTLVELSTLLYKTNLSQKNDNSKPLKIYLPIRGIAKTIVDENNENRTYLKIPFSEKDYVLSPWDGVVVHVGDFDGHPMVAVHKGDMIAFISGSIDSYCKVGDSVKMGDPLGMYIPQLNGELTMEIMKNDKSIDPAPFI